MGSKGRSKRTTIFGEAEDPATQAFLAAIVDSSDDAIFGKTLEGVILSWNHGAERMFGYSAAEVVGRPVSILVPPGNTDEVPHILEKLKRGECVDHFETIRVRKNGETSDVSLTISPIKDASGRIVGASTVARDITERKQAEEEIRRLNESLEQRVRERTAELEAANEEIRRLNESLEQRVRERTAELEATNQELEAFSYSVSHDLRAPLRHVDGFSRLLVEEFGPQLTEPARHYVDRIQKGTRQMGQLVDDLLNLSRVGRRELSVQIAGLNSIVQEAVSELQAENPGRKITWKITSLPFVECDPTLMKQAVLNLLANAVKFTRPRPEAVIEVGTRPHNGYQAVFVRDNGVGFNMKFAGKLFGVFQRLHRQEDFEGTGVGLATVKRIVQKHHGQVWAEAELDRGATFYFTLAADPPALTALKEAA